MNKKKNRSKIMYILAGPNGAGKTTFALSALEKDLEVDEFVNADEIARGLSPLKPGSVNLQAGRIMLKRINELVNAGKTFCIESTLAGKNYIKVIKLARRKGYKIVLFFLWLPSSKVAIDRVKNRVKQGGHNIPTEVIERRYISGLKNLVELYVKAVDRFYVIDSTEPILDGNYKVIAKKTSKSDILIYNKEMWQKIKDKA